MIHRNQGVGLAPAERRLDLDYRVSPPSLEAIFHHGQQMLETLGGIGLLEELYGIPVLIGCTTFVDLPQVRRENVHCQPA